MNFAFSNLYQISLFLGGIIALVSSFTVYYDGPKKDENIGWFLSNLFASVWSFGYLYMISTTTHDSAYLGDIVLHGAATFVPLFYFYFAMAMTNTYTKYKYYFYTFSVWAVLWMFLIPSRNFISDVFPKFIFNFAPDAGSWYIYFALYFFLLVLFALFIIFKDIRTRKFADQVDKKRMKFILAASVLGFGGGGSVFLLTFNVMPPYALPLFSIYPVVVTYAILKHRLFNVRVIATELFVFAIWMFIIVRILFSQGTEDRISNIILFLVTIFTGVFLIRSVWKEVHNREKLQELSAKLEDANDQLKALDKARAEFISIASHQLRTPPATIKWYLAAILGGDFGPVTEQLKKAVSSALMADSGLISLIDDLLNASRIERGKLEFIFEPTDIVKITKMAVDQLVPQALQRKHQLTLVPPKTAMPLITMDKEKVRQVINNFIDNSIKYTPTGGKIEVVISKTAKDVVVKVKDNGKGIRKDALQSVFDKYNRGTSKDSQGLGLGLYVAKVVIEQHNGKIWAESAGEGKGSSFCLSLPIKSDLKVATYDLVEPKK